MNFNLLIDTHLKVITEQFRFPQAFGTPWEAALAANIILTWTHS
jgi:hypothetical protein